MTRIKTEISCVYNSGITTWSVNTKLDQMSSIEFRKKNRHTINKFVFWVASRCLQKTLVKFRFLVWHYNGKCLSKTRNSLLSC